MEMAARLATIGKRIQRWLCSQRFWSPHTNGTQSTHCPQNHSDVGKQTTAVKLEFPFHQKA